MKSLVKIISFMLLMVMMFSSVGCGSENNNNKGYEDILVSGFETSEEINHVFRVTKEMEEKTINSDEKYISQGNSSMKIKNHSGRSQDYYPTYGTISPAIELVVGNTDFGKDFSLVSNVFVDVYNANKKVQEIDFVLQLKKGINVYGGKNYLLPEQMNKCDFKLDIDRNHNFAIDDVQKAYFIFQVVEGAEETQVCYLDNLVFRQLDKGYEFKNQEIPEIKDDVFCSFEDDYFFNTCYDDSHSWPVWDHVTVKKNGNLKYVSDGNYSYQIIAPPYVEFFNEEPSYYRMMFSEEYCKAFPWENYKQESARVAWDIYLDYNEEAIIRLYAYDNKTSVKDEFVLLPGQWNTVEIYLHRGNAKAINWEKDIARFGFELFQRQGSGSAIYYVDNLRVKV